MTPSELEKEEWKVMRAEHLWTPQYVILDSGPLHLRYTSLFILCRVHLGNSVDVVETNVFEVLWRIAAV